MLIVLNQLVGSIHIVTLYNKPLMERNAIIKERYPNLSFYRYIITRIIAHIIHLVWTLILVLSDS